jgi:hypothetical protein
MKDKVKVKKLKGVDGRQRTLKPFEDLLNLATLVRFNLRSRHVGAYFLRKGPNRYCFVFGFECQGVHSYLRSDEVDPIFDNIEAGLKDLPLGERLTVHLGAFSSDRDRQTELANLSEDAPADELRFLLMGERARVRELTQLGLREPKYLRLYVTYTVDASGKETEDWAEKLLVKLGEAWVWFTDRDAQQSNLELRKVVTSAFTDGFAIWEQLLATKMGLMIRPLTEDELWSSLW